MSSSPPPPLVAVGQMTSTDDVDENLETCAVLARAARARGAALLCLPECFAFLGSSDKETRRVMAPLDGPLFSRARAIAKDAGLWIAFGGFPEKVDEEHNHNSHVVVDDSGAVRAVYRKLHLFDVTLPNGTQYRESACTAPGKELVVAESPVGPLGLSICYDLRFPELYLKLAAQGARVLLVPAAFTLTTGKEHWEALLRARAIETQCWVVAAAQTGRHNEKRDTYGHAMIVDPWGTVVAQCSDGTGIAVAPLDPAFLDAVRARVPVWQHRRPDVYG
jgi:deaminated glutathione amidase